MVAGKELVTEQLAFGSLIAEWTSLTWSAHASVGQYATLESRMGESVTPWQGHRHHVPTSFRSARL